MIKGIIPTDLKTRLEAQEDILVIDVRNPHELEIANVDFSYPIPLYELPERANTEIPKDKIVVFMCRSGIRSLQAAVYLANLGWPAENLLNLEGGILRWAREIDPTLPTSY